jgi:RimJ/RimL family protein N-acetyltransferase
MDCQPVKSPEPWSDRPSPELRPPPGLDDMRILTMDRDFLIGKLVRLTAENPDIVAEACMPWLRDSEYMRLLDMGPAILRSEHRLKEQLEHDSQHIGPNRFYFSIRTLADDQLIGGCGLVLQGWTHGDAEVWIGIGERDFWGKGCGTDAMNLVLRYAFQELNLHRVTLGAFAYNRRAIRSYENAGFRHEGRSRQFVMRNGQRHDGVEMGILRREWDALVASLDETALSSQYVEIAAKVLA